MHRRAVSLLIAVVAGLIGVGCSTGAPDHVRIGLVAPLSGERAYLGQEIRDGARLAVEDLNAAGGLLGEPVELVVRDDSDLVDVPGHLGQLAERSRVSAVVGPETPGVLLGPRNPLSRRDVPAVLATGFAGDLSRAASTVVRTVPSARDQALALGRWLRQAREINAVALLVADPLEGDLAARSVTSGLDEAGVDLAAVVEADATAGDLSAAVDRLRDRAPDAGAALLWASPPAAARATRAARGLGWDVQLMVPATAFVAEYRTLARAASEGVVMAFPFREAWFGPEMQRWLVRWHTRHGIGSLAQLDTLVLDLPVAGLAAYDAVGLIAAAVRDAGTRRPAAVADALAEVSHDGLLQRYALGGDTTGAGDDRDPREAWSPDDLYVARFHNYAVVYDIDPRLDTARQRRFYRFQVQASYLPDEILDGPAGDVIRGLLNEGRRSAPAYEPPAPPPGPVATPEPGGPSP